MDVDQRVPGFLGRVLDGSARPAATCFQVSPGVLVTAWHVLDDLGAADVDAVISVDPLQGGEPRQAQVKRIDPVHDLAVLAIDEPLPASVTSLASTDEVELDTRVVITGVSHVEDPGHAHRYLDAAGRWRGGTTRDDQIPLGRLSSTDVVLGMSGAPVRRRDGAVVGVVSARYNSADDWLRGTVWVARVENLALLLHGLAAVDLAKRRSSSPAELTLTVDESRVRLSGARLDVVAEHHGVSIALAEAVRGLAQARARWTTRRATTAATPGHPPNPEAIGQLLAESFLPHPVVDELAKVITDAESRWAPVRLGVIAEGELGGLLWEALPAPGAGRPLALHPLVTVYRRHDAPPAPAAPGPLRILIAISAPLSGGGQVLDYERELRNVHAAVRGARQSRAQVRVVHFATTTEINAQLRNAQLRQEPVHVLHLSGHGRPGLLELENEDGNARQVTADQFVAEAIPPGGMPPVIALAACHTDAAASGDPSFAARLIERGASVVIGTETAVTDVYATRAFARIYGALASTEAPDVLDAVAEARRTVQQELQRSSDKREQHLGALGEWVVLTVLARSGSAPLLDPTAPTPEAVSRPVSPWLPAALLARQVGEFVGRRREQRRWPAELVSSGTAGLVLHGIGGVGKTTLATELARRMVEREPDRLVVLVSGGTEVGELGVDQVLGTLATAVRRRLGGPVPDEVLAALRDAVQVDLDWRERLAGLRQQVLDDVPVLLVLDNFEDNLTDHATGGNGRRSLRDVALAMLLAELVGSPARCRLLITCRYPFTLPGAAERVLSFKHLGPLSFAETLKLAWALPGLDRLGELELEQVWRMVGGHPRSLEYLDALLCGGQSTYPDVTRRLASTLRDRLDVDDLDTWFAEHSQFDPALTEILTLAADDVLLDRLLASLAEVPGAQQLLLGASVYRSAVGEAALLFQVGEEDPAAEYIPDRRAAERRITDILTAAGVPLDGPIDPSSLAEPLRQRIGPYVYELYRRPTPPWRAPGDLRRLVETCSASSLLTLDASAGEPTVFVHRWTATELHRRWADRGQRDELTGAHLHAAEYWQWRVRVWPQDRALDLEDRLEARYHLLDAGEPDHAAALTEVVCDQLHNWGAWDREEALIHDTLAHLPAWSDRLPFWWDHLGDIAANRGLAEEAAGRYAQGLAVGERLVELAPDNTVFQRGLSVSYCKLGDLDVAAGRPGEAMRRYAKGLAIAERLAELDPDDTVFQQDLSIYYTKLGDLDRAAGRPRDAVRRYAKGLAIAERLAELDPDDTDFQRGLSVFYSKLGDLDYAAGRPEEAAHRYAQDLAIAERLVELDPANVGFQRDVGVSYRNLGDLDEAAGRLAEASRRYTQSLAVAERLVELDPANTEFQRDLCASHERLGNLDRTAGREEAAHRYAQGLVIAERLVELDPANTDFQRDLGILYTKLGGLDEAAGREEAARRYAQGLAIVERLVELDPDNTDFQWDLGVSYMKLGDLDRAAGRVGEAAHRYAQGLATVERLLELDPDRIGFQQNLSTVYERLGVLDEVAGRVGEAARRFAQGLAIRERLVEQDPANTDFQRNLSVSYERLGDLDVAAERSPDAQKRYAAAGDVRRGLLGREPDRADLAEELSVALRRLAQVSGESTQREAVEEIISVLAPFEQAGTITPKGSAVLDWARDLTG